MCEKCCSHVPRRQDGPCHGLHALRGGTELAVLQLDEPPFPGERVILDVTLPSELRLISAVAAPERDDRTSTPRGFFGISRCPTDSHGSIAEIDFSHRFEWRAAGSVRLVVNVVGRYERTSEPDRSASYPQISADFLCERTTATVFMNFPPEISPRRGVSTRSSARKRSIRRRRASLEGLPYGVWRNIDPHHLLARIRGLVSQDRESRPRFNIDQLLVEAMPDDDSCVARWSFWIAAIIRASPENKDRLLRTVCTTTRLRQLLELLQRNPPGA